MDTAVDVNLFLEWEEGFLGGMAYCQKAGHFVAFRSIDYCLDLCSFFCNRNVEYLSLIHI